MAVRRSGALHRRNRQHRKLQRPAGRGRRREALAQEDAQQAQISADGPTGSFEHTNRRARAVSLRTHTSRYFSAASNVLDTPTRSPVPTREDQRGRAIANGAARFLSSTAVIGRDGDCSPQTASSTASAAPAAPLSMYMAPSRTENTQPAITPVTITHAGAMSARKIPKLCSRHATTHGQHQQGLHLDGSTMNPHDHVHVRDQHQRAPRGTWRTRMQRTHCWQCELEGGRDHGWVRLRRLLDWTCFCRFHAYESDDSDDDMARNVEADGVEMRGFVLGSTG